MCNSGENMKKKIIEKYEANIQLNTLYEVLDALYSKYSFWYPNDIKEDINKLLSKINDYVYHGHVGYDVIDEKWYSEFTFIK